MNTLSHKTIGILGDGQLARFLALSAHQLGIHTLALTQTPALTDQSSKSPLSLLAELIPTSLDWQNAQAIDEISKRADIFFLESEFIPAESLSRLHPLYPSLAAYKALDSKLKQKQLARLLQIPVPEYQFISDPSEIPQSISEPLILKSIRGGYDGKGNLKTSDRNQILDFLKTGGPLLAEKILPFKKEIAVMVARAKNPTAKTIHWPITDTVQENHICHYLLAPADISKTTEISVLKAADAILNAIDAEGLFGFEFFIMPDDSIVFNEIAPRPHNSGHWTIEGTSLSQYEALLRIGLGLPLPEPKLLFPAVGMLNLLGTSPSPSEFRGHSDFFDLSIANHLGQDSFGKLHLYGKRKSKPGRKMGHFTLCGQDRNQIENELKRLRTQYEI